MARMTRSAALLFAALSVAFVSGAVSASADGCGGNRGCGSGSGSSYSSCGNGRSYGRNYGYGRSYRAYSRGCSYGYGRGYCASPYRSWAGVRNEDGTITVGWSEYAGGCGSGGGGGYFRSAGCSTLIDARAVYGHATCDDDSPTSGAESVQVFARVPSAPSVPLTPRAAAHDALFRGDFDAAETGFQKLAAADAKDASAWTGVAHAAFGLRHFELAADALDHAARLGGVSPTERLDLAATHRDADGFRSRLDGLRARVRYHLFDAEARLVLAWLEAGTGDLEGAIADAKRVLVDRIDDPCALALLGRKPAETKSSVPANSPTSPTVPTVPTVPEAAPVSSAPIVVSAASARSAK